MMFNQPSATQSTVKGTSSMRARLTLLLVFSLAAIPSAQSSGPYDLIVRNARIVDGTASPWYRGDIAVRGDTIALIAPRIDAPATRVIDIGGLVASPGFIDIHTHARRGIFEVPTADNYVRQGVTTLIEGPDGGSPIPLAPFLQKVEAIRITPNFASFIGQGSVRSTVMGEVDRAATPGELEKMRALVRQGMEEGAFGLSSGLFYVPGTFTPTEEVIDLAKVAGQMGGIYISHMRDEAKGLVESVRETIAIGERGGLPTQITHHKVVGKKYWGGSVNTLRQVDEARARGVDSTIDQYPYTASATSIAAALLPAWAQEGGRESTLKRLKDPTTRARIKAESVAIIRDERGGGDPKNVAVSACQFDPSLAGKNLAQITQGRGLPVTIENAAETTLWIVEQGGCQGIFHAIGEQDLERIIVHPATMIASDGEIPIFGRNSPHPRSYGTFARVLGVYVRDKKLLSLETAVQKMSALPAQRLGLGDRGVLRTGMKADIAVFDPMRVRDTATFEKPHAYAEGVTHVIINGQVAFENGKMTTARPGRILYGPASKRASQPSAPPASAAAQSRNFVSPNGTRMRILVDGADVRGTEVEIVELTFPPNSDSGDHRHAVTETFYVLEGEMEQVINGTPVKLTPGTSASIRATDQVRHRSGPNGAKVLVVWAPGGEIARVTAKWTPQ
jgi:dihydroorotase/N-acyl-D-amino-acid deacylase